MERCKNQDYLEFIKRNVIDIFNDEEGDVVRNQGNNIDIVVDDDLLMGIDKGSKNALKNARSDTLRRKQSLRNAMDGLNDSTIQSEGDPSEFLNGSSFMDDSLNSSNMAAGYNTRRLTALEVFERKISR